MRDKITALIPTYERPAYLRRAILSVAKQTYDNLQISIFDNASGDNTEAVVRELSEHDPRIRYVRHGHNVGALANFKVAFRSVDTPYFSILSDDDFLARDCYESAIEVFNRHPEVMFVILNTLIVDQNTNLIGNQVSTNELRIFSDQDRFDALYSGDIPTTWTAILFRKEVAQIYVDMHDVYDVASDMRFLFHAAARYNFAHLSKVGAFFTHHSRSTSAARKNFDLAHHVIELHRYIEIINDKEVDQHIQGRAAFHLRRLLSQSPYKAAAICALKGLVRDYCDSTADSRKMMEMDIQNFKYEGYLRTSVGLYFLYRNTVIRRIVAALFSRYKKQRTAKKQTELRALENGVYKELFDHIEEISTNRSFQLD
jgi:glycosyltransferase involved in cell wall biosynthesis